MTINELFFCLVWRGDKRLRCMRMQMRLFGPSSVVFYCKTSIKNTTQDIKTNEYFKQWDYLGKKLIYTFFSLK